MIIFRLTGGLGNQLFQYAIGKALSIISKEKMLFDVSSYTSDKLRNYELGIFNLGIDLAETADVKKINMLLHSLWIGFGTRYYENPFLIIVFRF